MQTYRDTASLSSLLEEATQKGEIRIELADGRAFVLKPEKASRSPFDVPGIDSDVSTAEIVAIIREGRERSSTNSLLTQEP